MMMMMIMRVMMIEIVKNLDILKIFQNSCPYITLVGQNIIGAGLKPMQHER